MSNRIARRYADQRDQAEIERDEARREVDLLREWQSTVTAILCSETGALYEDVPQLARALRYRAESGDAAKAEGDALALQVIELREELRAYRWAEGNAQADERAAEAEAAQSERESQEL